MGHLKKGEIMRELTKEQFLVRAENICATIGRETGKYFYVEKVNSGPNYDIFCGQTHIIQSDDFSFILGFLRDVLYAFREEITPNTQG